jgi:2-dehydropantoate 2-reductase
VWRDLAVRKRRTEVDAHFGPIVAEAERRGLEVPLLRRLIALMHEIEDGTRELSVDNLAALGPVRA